MARESEPSSPNASVGRLMVLILLLSLGGIILYKYYQKTGGNYTFFPKELQINYMPADFEMSIDEDRALEILSNPQRNRQAFNDLVYELNLSILNHVATRMGLSDSLRSRVREEYEKHHPYLRNLYFNDFIAIRDTTSNLYETWYDNESTSATAVLREVASKYTCFLVNQIFTTLLKTQEGSIFARGSKVDTPCGLAMTEALEPMMKRMEERAAIHDFSRSRGLMQEKVERVVAELATMEVRDKKGLNKTMQTKLWGFAVSSTDIEISAISILKVGFKINDYFDISLNSNSGIVTVTLPEPQILSHEVYPKFDKLDIGWLREVKGVDLNKAFNALRAEFRNDALESDIMEKSKTQAVELMNTMFSPLLSSLNRRYKLKIQFRTALDTSEDPDLPFNEQFQD